MLIIEVYLCFLADDAELCFPGVRSVPVHRREDGYERPWLLGLLGARVLDDPLPKRRGDAASPLLKLSNHHLDLLFAVSSITMETWLQVRAGVV